MGMEDVVLLGGFAAIAIFGYYIMAKLDNFLDKVRQENEEQAQTTCLNIATSCVNVIPAVSNILKDINHLHPDVHCNLSVGHEQDVIKSFDCGDADVVIISADSDTDHSRCKRQEKDKETHHALLPLLFQMITLLHLFSRRLSGRIEDLGDVVIR